MHTVWKIKSPSTVLLKKPVLCNFLNRYSVSYQKENIPNKHNLVQRFNEIAIMVFYFLKICGLMVPAFLGHEEKTSQTCLCYKTWSFTLTGLAHCHHMSLYTRGICPLPEWKENWPRLWKPVKSCLSIPEVLVGSYCTFFPWMKRPVSVVFWIFSEKLLFKETLTGAKCIQMVYGLLFKRTVNQKRSLSYLTRPPPLLPPHQLDAPVPWTRGMAPLTPESPLAECPSLSDDSPSPTYMTRVVGQPHPVKRQLGTFPDFLWALTCALWCQEERAAGVKCGGLNFGNEPAVAVFPWRVLLTPCSLPLALKCKACVFLPNKATQLVRVEQSPKLFFLSQVKKE